MAVGFLGLPFLGRVGSLRSGERGGSGDIKGTGGDKADPGALEKGVGTGNRRGGSRSGQSWESLHMWPPACTGAKGLLRTAAAE